MPGTNSRNLSMSEENFPAMRSASNQVPLARRWTCPNDHTIAAYVDNALPKNRKARAESHLSRCERCRLIVADLVTLQREVELPVPPVEVTPRIVPWL
jgi:anti-sigma factor RsiW